MRRTGLVLAMLVGLLGLGAAPVAAQAPVRDTISQSNTVQDQGEACGFPVRWQIDLQGQRTRYYDASGRLVREHVVIREDNTVTNLDTGLTLREGPVAFVQDVRYHPDGSVVVTTSGTSVLVRGADDDVVDHGRLVVRYAPGQAPDVLLNLGPHHPRELTLGGGGLAAVLAAFCDVLAPA